MGWFLGIVLGVVLLFITLSYAFNSGKGASGSGSVSGMSEKDYEEYWEGYSRHH